MATCTAYGHGMGPRWPMPPDRAADAILLVVESTALIMSPRLGVHLEL